MMAGTASPSNRYESRERWLSGYILFCVAFFVAAAWWLMLSYRGNNPFDPDAVGYDFWRNTLCDLGKSGRYAQGSWAGPWLFTLAMGMIASSLGPLFWILSTRFAASRWRRIVIRCLGAIAAAGAVAVGLTPADAMEVYHAAAIGAAAVPGLIAMLLAAYGIFRSPRLSYKTMTALFLVLAVVHFTQYVRQFWLGMPWTPTTPMVQKLTVMLALAWFAWTALLSLSANPRQADSRKT